jgi:RimJ/RimL family protein N-acetyltransferase
MLKGKKINLRLVRENDLERMYELWQDVEARGDFFPAMLTSEPAMRKRYAEGGYWSEDIKMMLIVDREKDCMHGMVACFKPVFYQDSMEFGYILHDIKARGKGYVTEAVELMTDYIFKFEKVYRVQLQIETPNGASRRVAEKAGFCHEGTLRQCLINRGHPVDMEMYGLTRSDWEKRQASKQK